ASVLVRRSAEVSRVAGARQQVHSVRRLLSVPSGAVLSYTVRTREPAGKQARTGRHTGGGTGIGAIEPNTIREQLIEARHGVWAAVAGGEPRSLLIGHQQDAVRPGTRCHEPLCSLIHRPTLMQARGAISLSLSPDFTAL